MLPGSTLVPWGALRCTVVTGGGRRRAVHHTRRAGRAVEGVETNALAFPVFRVESLEVTADGKWMEVTPAERAGESVCCDVVTFVSEGLMGGRSVKILRK